MMSVTIGAYQAVYFESVAQAVEYCHALVSHIVLMIAVLLWRPAGLMRK